MNESSLLPHPSLFRHLTSDLRLPVSDFRQDNKQHQRTNTFPVHRANPGREVPGHPVDQFTKLQSKHQFQAKHLHPFPPARAWTSFRLTLW